ncbi:MAG: biotin/lipoyl-binding protein, partial [Actinobacteria bacterium]|nr:biotin/lipoyl-binding protein [Actinomycetota bacterium]
MRPASPTPAARSRARHPLPSQRAGRPDALAHISIRSVGLASLATAAVIGLAACDALVQTIEPTPTLITQRESVRQRPMVPVVRGDLIEAIRTTARVEAEKRDHLFFKTDGRVQLIKVRQGDRVKAGDVLATLEPGRLEADIASAQEAVNTSQLRLDAARNKAVNEKAQAESKLANAELALEKRQLEFERVLLRATPEQATALGAKPAAAAATPPADPAVSDAEASLFRAQQSLSDARARLAALEVMGSLSDSQAQAQAQAELMPLYASQAAALRDLAAAREEASRAGLDRASAGTPLDIASASARVQEARRALAGAELRLRDLEAGGSTAETAARESAQGKIDAAVAGVSAARARLAAAENAAVARNAELTNMAVSARAQAVDRLEQLKSTIAAKQLQLAEATTALDGTVNRPTPLQVAEAQAILEKARLTRDDIVRTGSGASAQAKEKAEIDYQVAQRAYKEAVRPATAAEIASARATADLAASALTLAQNELVHVLAGGSEAAALERLGQEYRGAIAQDAASAVADRDVARSALAEAEVALAQLMGAGTMTQAIERVAQEILADSALTLDGARADVAAARARITAA